MKDRDCKGEAHEVRYSYLEGYVNPTHKESNPFLFIILPVPRNAYNTQLCRPPVMMPDLHTVNIYSTNLVNIKLKVNLIQIQILDIIHHGLLI